jgi:mRNA interferase MazF
LKRGDIVTVAAKGEFGGQPRPAVVVQADQFDTHSTVVLCPFTTNPTAAPAFRVVVEPSATNALTQQSSLMVDKLISVPRGKIGRHVGRLLAGDMSRLDRALLIFLGLIG